MEGRGGGSREQGGRSALSGSRGCAPCERGKAAAGPEKGAGDTGVVGAASGLVGGSDGDGGKVGGSGSYGRTGHDEWGLVCLSPPGMCGAGWWGEGCGRLGWGAGSEGWGWATSLVWFQTVNQAAKRNSAATGRCVATGSLGWRGVSVSCEGC